MILPVMKRKSHLHGGTVIPLLWNLFCFFSLAVDMNVNVKAVVSRINDVSCATDHVMKFPRPSPFVSEN